MNYLIRRALVIDRRSPHNGQRVDLEVVDGRIRRIARESLSLSDRTTTELSRPDWCVAPGWCELAAAFGEPGFEQRETIESGLAAAARGGFATVATLPDTDPVIDNKAQVRFLKNQAADHPVELLPIGASTQALGGRTLAEMYDMHRAGAVAFSHGLHSLPNAATMLRVLQYVSSFEGLIIDLPVDEDLAAGGQVNEGTVSTRMGLKGQPNLAELLRVRRGIELARYTQTRLHFMQLSTREAVLAIGEAKAQGVPVTAAVSPWHLVFTEEKLLDFNAYWKLNPPLRTEADRQALIAGLRDGTIDAISCLHRPLHLDEKRLEFDRAEFGAVGLETTFGLLRTQTDFTLEELTDWLSAGPRRVLDLPRLVIEEGATACLTLFEPKAEYTIDEAFLTGRSANSPLLGAKLKGRAAGVVGRGRAKLFDR